MQKLSRFVHQALEWGGFPGKILVLSLSLLSLTASLFSFPFPVDPAWVAIVLCGLPVVMESLTHLITHGDIRAGFLVSLALLAAIFTKEYFAAGEVALIMQLGELLEHMAAKRANREMKQLIRLTPRTARVLRRDLWVEVEASSVQVGEHLQVLPGETVPVDGVLLQGDSLVDESAITGESMPAEKRAGDSVFSGTVNQFGAFTMLAQKVGEDSTLQRTLTLVQQADAKKAKVVRIADRWATGIVLAALLTALVVWLVTGEVFRAVTILVVFCPCSLVLATPTALIAAMSNAARQGFLVRKADALEQLAQAEQIVFDKTGTLTQGKPEVSAILALPPYSQDQILQLAAAAEQNSEHPFAKGILMRFGKTPEPCQGFSMTPGLGIKATVAGKEIWVGNGTTPGLPPFPEQLLDQIEVLIQQGQTPVFVWIDSLPAGCFLFADPLRPESVKTVAALKTQKIQPVMLTGDSSAAAETVAQAVGIQSWQAGCLPQSKLAYLQQALSQGKTVCMVGDGINDAPALKAASVGIAMGGIGSDIAAEASDIILVSDQLNRLPHLFRLAHRTMSTVRVNIIGAMILNFVAIVLAATGQIGPVMGALIHNAGSIFVVLHALMLLR